MNNKKESAKENNSSGNGHENVIEISHVKKKFGEQQVLADVSLSLHKEENLVVLGKSGSGKSVLIKCIVGLLFPDEGKINVLGKEVQKLNEKELNELRKKIGFLFQGGALYDSMTVKENLVFPLMRVRKNLKKKEMNNKVIEVLENVNLVETIDKMPSELSGGMRKRIALARTIIIDPVIMLYDEPTTGLDTETADEINQLILDVQKKYHTSSIIITHDLLCAKATGNRIVVLKEGKIFTHNREANNKSKI